jgi:hypothetical protein
MRSRDQRRPPDRPGAERSRSRPCFTSQLRPLSDIGSHKAVPGSHACASTNAGLDRRVGSNLLVATSTTRAGRQPTATASVPQFALSRTSGESRPSIATGERRSSTCRASASSCRSGGDIEHGRARLWAHGRLRRGGGTVKSIPVSRRHRATSGALSRGGRGAGATTFTSEPAH